MTENRYARLATTRMNQQLRSSTEEMNNRMLSAGPRMRLMEISLFNGEVQILGKMDHPIILEKDLGNGRRVDIFATIDDKRVGIEIAQNSNVDVWQLLKAQQNLDELVIVCKDRSVLKKLEERIREVAYPSVFSKIRFYLVTKYLSKLRSDVRARKLAKKSNYPKNPDSGLIQDKKAEKEGKS